MNKFNLLQKLEDMIIRKNTSNKRVDQDIKYESFYATLSEHDKTRLYCRNLVLKKLYNIRDLDFDKMKSKRGRREMIDLPFYDILQNPLYRMRFEYTLPFGIDENGKYIF